jgi:hypothetical protein
MQKLSLSISQHKNGLINNAKIVTFHLTSLENSLVTHKSPCYTFQYFCLHNLFKTNYKMTTTTRRKVSILGNKFSRVLKVLCKLAAKLFQGKDVCALPEEEEAVHGSQHCQAGPLDHVSVFDQLLHNIFLLTSYSEKSLRYS